MVYLVIFLLSVGSLMTAAPEAGNEKGAAVEGVQPKELTQVVANGAVKSIEKNVDEQKQAPITTLFFSKKTLSNMDFDELKTSKEDCLKNGDKRAAIKFLERMAQIRNDLEDLKGVMLELAQLLYETEDYKRASDMYNKFVLLYPGCEEVEQSMYRAIFCMSKIILDAEHDQTKTIETKELAQDFLNRSSFTQYRKEVEAILTQCEERLLENEICIFNFYLGRCNYVAAQTRLANIKETYAVKTIPDIQTKIASLDKLYAEATVNVKLESVVVAAQDKEEKIEEPVSQAV